MKHILSLCLALVAAPLFAEAPSALMTDLLEHTETVWKNGTPDSHRGLLNSQQELLNGTLQAAVIPNKKPAFSWIVNDQRQNIMQTAYQIVVSTKDTTLWDSGKVDSQESVAVQYAGKDLPPNTVINWKVKTWNNGDEQPFSETKTFLTASELVDYQTPRYPLEKTPQTPVKQEQRDGCVFLDFGKDAFGQLRLVLNEVQEERQITVHFGEAAKDGRVDRKPGAGSIRYAAHPLDLKKGTTQYSVQFPPDKINTRKSAVLMPEYIGEVYPFRYVELEGLKLSDIKAVDRDIVHYPFDDNTASFKSDNEILNHVWELCKYSMKATSFCGVFVDGDRERIPYEADALINQLGYYSVQRDYSIARYSHEYLIEHPTWPTEWILQSVLMANHDWMYTGDTRSAEKFYEDLKAKLLLPCADPNTGLISTLGGKQTPEVLKSIHYTGKELRDIVDWPLGERDGYQLTQYNTVVNAFHYAALLKMAELAEALNKDADAQNFRNTAERMKKSFNASFFDTKKQLYVDGTDTDHISLHSNLFALAFDLVPETDQKQKIFQFIKSKEMACSVYASQFLMDAVYAQGTRYKEFSVQRVNGNILFDGGDYGLQLLTSEAQRSWYNMIREGSTISMEAWDNKFKPNQDWNHAWGAVPANVIPRQLLGIQPLLPGFECVLIRPQIGTLNSISARIPTIRGTIEVEITGGNKMQLTIPANMKAAIVLPDDTLSSGTAPRQVGSGKHSFAWVVPIIDVPTQQQNKL